MGLYSRTIACLAAAGIFLLLGCQSTPQADIVVNKTEANYQESEISFLQYDCPEHYKDSYDVTSEYPTTVSVDAAVTVPKVEMLPVPEMSFTMLSQSNIDSILQGLVKDALLYQFVEVEDGRATDAIRSKEEIQQDIQAILDWLSNPSGDAYDDVASDPESLQLYIEQQRELLEQLQEEYNAAPNKADMPLSTGVMEWNDDRSAALLLAEFDNEKMQRCEIIVATSAESCTNMLGFIARGNYFLTQNIDPYRGTRDGNSAIDIDTAEQWAKGFLAELGIDGMSLAARGVDRYVNRSITSSALGRYKDCFVFAFTPSYAGVDRHYVDVEFLRNSTYQRDTTPYAPVWPDENLLVSVADDGILEMLWTSPFSEHQEAVLYENVAILPFMEILTQFQTQIGFAGSYLLQLQEPPVYRILHITDIKLGYCRILNSNDASTALLVPAWDFYGYEEIIYQTQSGSGWALDENNTLIRPAMGHSYLTINAIDGSVIDRRLGY